MQLTVNRVTSGARAGYVYIKFFDQRVDLDIGDVSDVCTSDVSFMQKIAVIKELREQIGCGLLQAKNALENGFWLPERSMGKINLNRLIMAGLYGHAALPPDVTCKYSEDDPAPTFIYR